MQTIALIKPEISRWQKNVCVMYPHMEIQCPVKRKRRNGSYLIKCDLCGDVFIAAKDLNRIRWIK